MHSPDLGDAPGDRTVQFDLHDEHVTLGTMSRTRGHRGCLKACGVCAIGTCPILKYRSTRAFDVRDFDEELALRTWDAWAAIADGEDDECLAMLEDWEREYDFDQLPITDWDRGPLRVPFLEAMRFAPGLRSRRG